MITIIPAGNGGSTPTPTPGQQLKIVSKDDSIKVFENDEDETERNIERFNFLAAEDIDNGASCYFNFVEEDNAGAGAKNLVEYVINTKEGRKINFSMICPYSPTSLDDFTIKITGDVLEDDGFYIELYSDPGDGEGNRYQGYFGVIWFYSASFNASGGDPDQQFFVQVAGDKTNVNWQWLGLSPEAYERLELLQDEGYYMRDFWEGVEQSFGLPIEEKEGQDIRIDSDKFNLISLSKDTLQSIATDVAIDNDDLIGLGLIKFNYLFSIQTLFTDYASKVALYGAFLGEIGQVINFSADRKYIYSNGKDLAAIEIDVTELGDIKYTTGPFLNTIEIEKLEGNEIYIDPNLPFILGSYAYGNRDILQAYNYRIINFSFNNNANLFYKAAFINMPNLEYVGAQIGYKVSNISHSSYRMFYNCPKLVSIYLSAFDFSKVTDMERTFENLQSLHHITFDNVDLSNVITHNDMFVNCPSLLTIYARNCNQATIDLLVAEAPAGATVVTA